MKANLKLNTAQSSYKNLMLTLLVSFCKYYYSMALVLASGLTHHLLNNILFKQSQKMLVTLVSKQNSQMVLKYYSLKFGPQRPSTHEVLRLVLDFFTKVSPQFKYSKAVLMSATVAITSEVEKSSPVCTQSELLTGVIIVSVPLLLLGGVYLLGAYNMLPAITVPIFSFFGWSNNSNIHVTDLVLQQRLDQLAFEAYKAKPCSWGNKPWGDNTPVVDTSQSVSNSALSNNLGSQPSNISSVNNNSVISAPDTGTSSVCDSMSFPSTNTFNDGANLSEKVSTTMSDSVTTATQALVDAAQTMAPSAASTVSSLATSAAVAVGSRLANTPVVPLDTFNVSVNNAADVAAQGGSVLGSISFGMAQRAPWTTNISPSSSTLSDSDLFSRTANSLNTIQNTLRNTSMAEPVASTVSSPAIHSDIASQVIETPFDFPLSTIDSNFYLHHYASNLYHGPDFDAFGDNFPVDRFEGWLFVVEGIQEVYERLIPFENMDPSLVFPALLTGVPLVFLLTTPWFTTGFMDFLKSTNNANMVEEFAKLIKQLCAVAYTQFEHNIKPSSRTDSNEYLYLQVCLETLKKNITVLLYGRADTELLAHSSKLNGILEKVEKLVEAQIP